MSDNEFSKEQEGLHQKKKKKKKNLQCRFISTTNFVIMAGKFLNEARAFQLTSASRACTGILAKDIRCSPLCCGCVVSLSVVRDPGMRHVREQPVPMGVRPVKIST